MLRAKLRLDQMRPIEGRARSQDRPLPIFLISFNRGEVLQKSIALLDHQDRAVEIVVNDFGSDDPATLQILSELEASGITIYRREKIETADDLNKVDDTVQDYMTRTGYDGRYAVSDCDIWFDKSSSDSIDVYEALLDRFPRMECAGPMLRIADIPAEYPLFEQVMNRHIDQFWQHKPIWLRCGGKRVPCLPAAFDTTFAIHRAGSRFQRLKAGLRVYQPYDATHIDWYLTHEDFWDSEYFKTSSSKIAHWNNQQYQEHAQGKNFLFNGFYEVEWASGTGRTVWRKLK